MRFWVLVLFYASVSTPSFASNEDLLKTIISRAQETGSDSLVIVQNHKLVYSDFFGQTDRVRNVQSITKSVAALAIAILLKEETIQSLDMPMSHWLPAWRLDSDKSKITLRMIMNHTSGLPHGTPDFLRLPDQVTAALSTPLEHRPGDVFLYSNVGATLLQPVIESAAGMPVKEFVQSRILKPLGISDRLWAKDEWNHERTSGGLSLSTADLLKIGEMLLERGRYNGNDVISEKCESLLLKKSRMNADYGLLWWLHNGLFYAQGWGGQFLIIDFQKNLIAIRTRDPKTIDWQNLEAQYYRDFVQLISNWQ